MNLSLSRHELSLMIKSKKNILFILFLIVGIYSYTFIFLPNQNTSESFSYEETKRELEVLYHVQKTREERRATGFSEMGGRNFYTDSNYYFKLQNALLLAYKTGDFKRYAYLRVHFLDSINEDFIYSEDLIPETPYPIKDRTHAFGKTLVNYQHLLSLDLPITYSLIEEKTALQVLKNFLLTIGPYLIIFCAIYFSNDVLVRDRRQTSTLQSLPVSWYQLINTKTFVAFFYTMLVVLGLMLIGIAFLTIKNGFGTFQLNVPVLGERIDNVRYDYGMISLAKFFILALGLAPIFIFIFIRLNMMFSILFRNEWVVLVLSTLCLLSERFYYVRDKRELFDINISNFPQTYIDFGKIVTGEKNYLINLETISYVKGITVLLITFVLVEILLFIITRLITKRRFYKV